MTPDKAEKRSSTTILPPKESETIDFFANDTLQDEQLMALFDSPNTNELDPSLKRFVHA